MKTELKPIYNNQNSFYGKATVNQYNGKIILTSYTTDVCYIDSDGFHRLWSGYSLTTMNHINEFLQQNGFKKLSKKEWLALPVEHYSTIIEAIKYA